MLMLLLIGDDDDNDDDDDDDDDDHEDDGDDEDDDVRTCTGRNSRCPILLSFRDSESGLAVRATNPPRVVSP